MKTKTRRVAGILIFLCIAAALLVGYRLYNKPHRSVETETAIVLTAAQLAADFDKDEVASNKKYLGNALQVSGTVSEVSVNQQNKQVVVLSGTAMNGVQCSLRADGGKIKQGDTLTIKGFCAGYLTDVIMDRCILVH